MKNTENDTRTKLIIAAERLFAMYGPEGATSRMILSEAGQRNASALSYHFKDRSELIEAIVKFRIEAIDDERMQLLMIYLADLPKPEDRLPSLIRIAVIPSVAPIIAARGKSYFRRFMASAIATPSIKFSELFRGKYDTALRQTAVLICREVPHLPRFIANKRVTTVLQSISYLTAPLEARCAIGAWSDRKVELEAELELLIDGFAGFMQAPHKTKSSAERAFSKIANSESELATVLI